MRQRAAALCAGWAGAPLRGERAAAWLVLAGAFDLKEHAGRAAELARDAGLPPALRIAACRALPRLGGEEAGDTLLEVLLSRADPQVRAAAAEALALRGDRSCRPVLEALLEEELPRGVWSAVEGALERLR